MATEFECQSTGICIAPACMCPRKEVNPDKIRARKMRRLLRLKNKAQSWYRKGLTSTAQAAYQFERISKLQSNILNQFNE